MLKHLKNNDPKINTQKISKNGNMSISAFNLKDVFENYLSNILTTINHNKKVIITSNWFAKARNKTVGFENTYVNNYKAKYLA